MSDQQPARPGPAGAAAPRRGPAPRRSRHHKVIGGVCGGLGRHVDIDPVVFRVVLGVLAVTGGIGLIVYGFAWLLLPLEGEDENEARRLLSGRVDGQGLTAVLCALTGCGLLLSTLHNGSVLAFAVLLSVATAGTAYWSRYRRNASPEGAGGMPPAHTATGSAPGPHGAPAPHA
ncbi:PspC domain-containing protein, partial [Streptomyces sp. URMC 123]|uniref:PspC domain-containing protein n=1 Tax=Streptomyces sp. URMC 123 TaxID=3423403 RepID=UPI003F1CCDCF